jgi:hypothetical protein
MVRTICVALPLASVAVLVTGLLWRGKRPVWLLAFAAAGPTAVLVISLMLLPDAGGDASLTLGLIVWSVLCLLVLGLALSRRWRGELSRPLEIAGMVMPVVVLLPLAAFFLVQLLEPAPIDVHEPVFRDVPGVPVVAQVEARSSQLEVLP